MATAYATHQRELKRVANSFEQHKVEVDRNLVSLLHLAAQSAGCCESEANIGSDAGCNATSAAIGNFILRAEYIMDVES